MIVAISRFSVKNGRADAVHDAFRNRPRSVEATQGFIGLEVFQQDSSFLLVTRWTDEPSFRAWHASPAHHASHAMIPPGIKLDPSQTLMLVGDRIDGATSESWAGELVMDLLLPMARMVREGSSLHVAQVDEDGRFLQLNASFVALLGENAVGIPLDDFINEATRIALRGHLTAQRSDSLLLQLVPRNAEPRSLRAYLRNLPRGFAIVAEPPFEDSNALERQLTALNTELAVLSRENVRQARLLEKANRDLRDAQWHMEKISEVLPICMSCRAVKNADGTWEDVATFLMKHSDFLSHGYCSRCASEMLDKLDEET